MLRFQITLRGFTFINYFQRIVQYTLIFLYGKAYLYFVHHSKFVWYPNIFYYLHQLIQNMIRWGFIILYLHSSTFSKQIIKSYEAYHYLRSSPISRLIIMSYEAYLNLRSWLQFCFLWGLWSPAAPSSPPCTPLAAGTLAQNQCSPVFRSNCK